MNESGLSTDVGIEVGKASPPIAVAGSIIVGFSLQDWVLVLTLCYLVLQIAWMIRKFVKAANDADD